MAKIRRLEELLREISGTLRELSRRMDKLEGQATVNMASPRSTFVPGTLTSLPEHLRKSMENIVVLGQATAEKVAERTGRSRAAESDYLNQLVDRGFLRKQREGKEIVFQVFNLHAICSMCGNRVLITAKYCNLCGASLFTEEQILAKHGRNRV